MRLMKRRLRGMNKSLFGANCFSLGPRPLSKMKLLGMKFKDLHQILQILISTLSANTILRYIPKVRACLKVRKTKPISQITSITIVRTNNLVRLMPLTKWEEMDWSKMNFRMTIHLIPLWTSFQESPTNALKESNIKTSQAHTLWWWLGAERTLLKFRSVETWFTKNKSVFWLYLST